MVSPEIILIATVFLAALALGGVVYFVAVHFISGGSKTEKRIQSVSKSAKVKAKSNTSDEAANRRKKIEETIEEMDAKAKAKADTKLTMRLRLVRAGIEINVKTFYIICLLMFPLVALPLHVLAGVPVYGGVGAGFVVSIGAPRWLLSFMAKRRQKKFIEEFANAIDIIVRGVKTGLPLFDCLNIIAKESVDPLKSEFMELVEQQRLGIPLGKGLERMYERMPLQEVNFLGIVITIQQQSGGNLAETLLNLSTVLRERKKLQGKIQAFSQEAKSSAAIIAALPIVVMVLVYLTTPQYISLLWTEQLGHYMLAGSALWMLCGVLVMRKMINFDY